MTEEVGVLGRAFTFRDASPCSAPQDEGSALLHPEERRQPRLEGWPESITKHTIPFTLRRGEAPSRSAKGNKPKTQHKEHQPVTVQSIVRPIPAIRRSPQFLLAALAKTNWNTLEIPVLVQQVPDATSCHLYHQCTTVCRMCSRQTHLASLAEAPQATRRFQGNPT